MRELWCAAQELDWSHWTGSAVRGRAGGERKPKQTGRNRRTRNVSFCESRRRFLCIITDLMDGNASDSIYRKFCIAHGSKHHFCALAVQAATLCYG
jgi:hypothetical protein